MRGRYVSWEAVAQFLALDPREVHEAIQPLLTEKGLVNTSLLWELTLTGKRAFAVGAEIATGNPTAIRNSPGERANPTGKAAAIRGARSGAIAYAAVFRAEKWTPRGPGRPRKDAR